MSAAPTLAISPLRQWGALARAELILLRRNKMQLVTGLALPLALPFLLLPLRTNGMLDAQAGARVTATFVLFIQIFVVYYNLLSSYVARREELVLKRLRAGACPDWVVLAGTAVPAIAMAMVQTVVLSVVAAVVLGISLPAHGLLLAVTVIFACVTFTFLALVTTAVTRTVESAQITCLPFIAILIIGSGTAVPLGVLPDWAQTLCALIPTAAMTELTSIGWLGLRDGRAVSSADAWLAGLPQLGIMLAWVAISGVLARAYFRWEPRE